ncbi:MAG TPA: S8 family serine peptidase [Steroidobacteraceae bacterium]|nr:S8 family serine peptidase [Steroidobacteraceae bacterium]
MTRALLLTLLMLAPAARAQIPLPGGLPGGLPAGLPGGLPVGVGLPLAAQQPLEALTHDVGRLADARRLGIHLLLRRHPDVLEADPGGNPIVRGEVLAFSPSGTALASAVNAGFSIVRERSLGALSVRIVVLEAPRGLPTGHALSLLRRLDPAGTYDFNSIYMQGGTAQGSTASAVGAVPSGLAGPGAATAVALGLIDGGVGTTQAVFQGSVIHQHGCGGTAMPSAHGTEVASLMVGRSARFGGAAPGATLYAADVYCGKPTGGAVDAIADAFAWLIAQHVSVINVSLVGPPNALLQQVVTRVVAQGFLIVAAVGNDGAAAPPLYPAAYPGVVGVTAVDTHRRVIVEAERGPQVMFAAPGADIPAATVPEGFAAVRGTSFAAPLVAGLLGARLQNDPSSDPAAAAHAAVAALARTAIHLGSSGRNTVFGFGLVGANLPTPRPSVTE